MSKRPSRGKLDKLYSAVGKDKEVSRKDLERIAEDINQRSKEDINQTTSKEKITRQDINNLLSQERRFMIPHPNKEGYFVRNDSFIVSNININSGQGAKSMNFDTLNTLNLPEKIQWVAQEYKAVQQRIDETLQKKESLEQQLRQDQQRKKQLEDAMEAALEFFRKAA